MTTSQRIAALWIERKLSGEERYLRPWIGKTFLATIGKCQEWTGVRLVREYLGSFAARCTLEAEADCGGLNKFCVDDLQNGWREENHIDMYWDELQPGYREPGFRLALQWGVTRQKGGAGC